MRAKRAPDGTYRITGKKIFITYGEHDHRQHHSLLGWHDSAELAARHARHFVVLVPHLLNADGSPGARNDVRAHSIEHKLGIHGSPTCTMVFGDHGGATGSSIGKRMPVWPACSP